MSEPLVAYFDDSGCVAWPKTPRPYEHQCFCAGLLLGESKQEQMEYELELLLQGLSDATGKAWRELHMSQYMPARRSIPGLRAYCSTLVLEAILRLRPVLVGRVVDFEALAHRRGAHPTVVPFHYGLQSALYRMNHIAERSGSTFRAYVDGGDNRHERELRKFVASLKKPQAKLIGDRHRTPRLLDRMTDNVAILDSDTSPGIQFADAVTWYVRQFVLHKEPWVRRLDRLWDGEPPRVVPGGGPIWLSDDHASERAAVDQLASERLLLRDRRLKPAGIEAPSSYAPPVVPPPGARVKSDRFPWI